MTSGLGGLAQHRIPPGYKREAKEIGRTGAFRAAGRKKLFSACRTPRDGEGALFRDGLHRCHKRNLRCDASRDFMAHNSASRPTFAPLVTSSVPNVSEPRGHPDRSHAAGQSPTRGWPSQTPLAHKEKGPARDLFSGLQCASGGARGIAMRTTFTL